MANASASDGMGDSSNSPEATGSIFKSSAGVDSVFCSIKKIMMTAKLTRMIFNQAWIGSSIYETDGLVVTVTGPREG